MTVFGSPSCWEKILIPSMPKCELKYITTK